MFVTLMKPFFLLILFLFFIATAILFGGSCANIIPPSGGPRDTLPPRLINATPPDSTRNFKGNKIILSFDEYVDLQDIQNNLLFTPTFENNPLIEAKGKTLTVKFRDSLEAATTYILNFGNAIKDINEGNVLKNFVYIFSTGTALDSLTLSGKVVLAQTGGIDSTLIVILHKNLEDSAVINKRPQYVSRLDASGSFHFYNLPPGTFAIYALGDAGLSRRYQNKNQFFAFKNTPVIIGANDTAVTLYAYRETLPNNLVAPGGVQKGLGKTDRRLIFTTNLTTNQLDLLNDLILNFPVPLRSFDSSKIALTTDSAFTSTPYTVTLDSTKKELRIGTQWKEDTRYNLVLNSNFAEDTSGKKLLKSDTLFFSTKKASEYGSLSIRLKNIDLSKNPVLQFVQNGQVVFAAPVPSGVFSKNRFLPGDYELRILYDTNGNGKWDTGHFFGTKRQPELVHTLEQKITVKPAWDNEYER